MPAAQTPAWRWAAIGLLVATSVAGIGLAKGGGNPQWFIHFGTQSTVVNEGRRVLGPHILIPHTLGQDGQTFWLMARDPLLLHPARDASAEDRPSYREQRVLYPLLAAPFRIGGEQAIVWGLLVVNLVAVTFGAYWAAVLARLVGAPERFSLAFVFNPAVLIGLLMDTSDALVVALLVCAVALWLRRQPRDLAWASAVFALAALTKEIAVVVPAVLALHELRRARWRDGAVMVLPAIAGLGVWGVYERARLGWPSTSVQELAWPFFGFKDAYVRGWRPFHDWAQMAFAGGLVILAVLIGVAWYGWRQDLMLAAVPFAVLVPFLSSQVLDLGVNSARAMGPALSFFAIAVAAKLLGRQPDRPILS